MSNWIYPVGIGLLFVLWAGLIGGYAFLVGREIIRQGSRLWRDR